MTRGTLRDASGTITAGGTAQTVLAVNPDRKYLLVQNISDEVMYVNFGKTAAAAAGSILLPADGKGLIFEGSYCPTGMVSIFAATTGKAFTVKEG